MKRPRLHFIIAGALSMVQPDRWVPLGSSNGHADYLDRESVKRSGSTVTLWTRRDFVTQQRTAWIEIEVDCSSKRDTILAYVEDNAGAISHNIVRPHRGSTVIRPNSVEERVFGLVCR